MLDHAKLDHAKRWPIVPDWRSAVLAGNGIEVRSRLQLSQHLVSGDIAAFAAAHGFGAGVGALGLAAGERYAVRVARDRLVVVGLGDNGPAPGWHPAGYAVTEMSAGLHVFEITGIGAMALVGRAAAIDPDNPGPSAAVSFAGLTGYLYRHPDTQTLRLHVDRGLASYIWSWCETQLVLQD